MAALHKPFLVSPHAPGKRALSLGAKSDKGGMLESTGYGHATLGLHVCK